MMNEVGRRQANNIGKVQDLERDIVQLKLVMTNEINELAKRYHAKELEWLNKQIEEYEREKLVYDERYQRMVQIKERTIREKNEMQVKIDRLRQQANIMKERALADEAKMRAKVNEEKRLLIAKYGKSNLCNIL